MNNSSTDLILGRGELYFGRFVPGTRESEGEMYLGNTPGFTVLRTVDELDRYQSYSGQKVKTDSFTISETYASTITTDNMNQENVALWFGGNVNDDGQPSLNTRTETFTVKRNRYYQLGKTYQPFGVRHVEPDIVFKKNGLDFDLDYSLQLMLVEGRFLVLADGEIDDGDVLSVTFQWRDSPSSFVESSVEPVVGTLRFIATNPVGPRKNYFFPFVRMVPNGALDLKSDQWQQFQFSVDIRKLNPLTQFYYILEVSDQSGYTEDEQAIVNEGSLTLDEFPIYEEILHVSVNTEWPWALLGLREADFEVFEPAFNTLMNETIPSRNY